MASLPQPASPSPSGVRLLSLKETAQRLTLSERALRSLIAQGILPTVQLTTHRKAVAESDLEAWVASRRTSGSRPGAMRGGS